MTMPRLTRRTRSRWTRTAAAGTAAMLGASALAGCSADHLGAAAVVDGHRISTDELQQSTRGYLEVVPGADGGNAQLRILERMILSRVIDAEAQKLGVHASPASVAKQRDSTLQSFGGRKSLVRQLASGGQPIVLAPSYVDRWFKDQVLYRRIAKRFANGGDPSSTANINRTTRALVKTSRAMDVEVNPRYGTWDPRNGLTPLVSGGLSKTTAELDK
jgi:SurA N-terminal domain